MVTTSCPNCMHPIELIPPFEIGQSVRCWACDSDLEVTWLFPVSLDLQDPSPLNAGMNSESIEQP